MLPPSPFFSTSIMPVLEANITTITSLELVSCDLKSTDVEFISRYIKKNKSLSILNLSRNDLFGNDGCNTAAKLLAKSMKKHQELSFVDLSKTGLGMNNDGIKIILEGSKGINSLVVNDNAFDKEGLALVTNFLWRKNEVSEFSMAGAGIGEEKEGKTKARILRDALEKNTTLEQICLGSNHLGFDDRVLSIVVSGIKGSSSLIHVDLSGNKIRRMPSMKLVAKFLSKNTSLLDLNMSFNGLPVKCATILMDALKKNTTLQRLSLMGNNVGDTHVPPIVDMLKNNVTLRSLDLSDNNLRVKTGRRDLLKALCDTTSLDSIANNSNHTCSVIIAGRNYGGTYEEELTNINKLENEGEKIRYKVVLALCVLNKDLYDPRFFDDVPLELMHKLLELVQQEIGCKGYGKGIVKSVKKRSKINRLSNLYEAIHQWPAFPSLFSRGPGKKKRKSKRKPKVADEEEDFVPSGFPKTKKRPRWMPSPEPVKPSRSSSRATNIIRISYADVENSDDES